jgi:hypothetical protein
MINEFVTLELARGIVDLLAAGAAAARDPESMRKRIDELAAATERHDAAKQQADEASREADRRLETPLPQVQYREAGWPRPLKHVPAMAFYAEETRALQLGAKHHAVHALRNELNGPNANARVGAAQRSSIGLTEPRSGRQGPDPRQHEAEKSRGRMPAAASLTQQANSGRSGGVPGHGVDGWPRPAAGSSGKPQKEPGGRVD